jgi:hypothetical protein
VTDQQSSGLALLRQLGSEGERDGGSAGDSDVGGNKNTQVESREAQAARNQKTNDALTALSKMGITGMIMSGLNTLLGKQAPASVTDAGTSVFSGIDAATGLQGQGRSGQTGLHGDVGVFDSGGNLLGSGGFGNQSGGTFGGGLGTGDGGMGSGGGRSAGDSDGTTGGGGSVGAGNEGGGIGAGEGLAQGGLSALAQRGMSNLGDYSDGGRLLRGPGDGVSDSIPATIANKQPARLADGEFVVPARIVSELGNGSTEAGARKLYQMLARVQNARKKSIGQGRVAVNSRAEKLLPA